MTAAAVLRTLVPKCDSAVFGRLTKERVRTATDLASLDKDDLRDLGLSMVERCRIIRWARDSLAMSPVTKGRPASETSSGMSAFGFVHDPPPIPNSSWQLPNAMPDVPSANAGAIEDIDEDDEASSERHLDSIAQRAEFWCAIASAVPPVFRRQSALKSMRDVRETILEEWFDVTHERVMEVYTDMFKSSSRNGGRINAHDLAEGFRRCGIAGVDDVTLARVMDVVNPCYQSELKLEEFKMILSRLKLGQLFGGSTGGGFRARASYELDGGTPVQLAIVDFNSHHCVTREITDARFREFCFGHRPSPQERTETPLIRWAHMPEFALTTLLCLTVKYNLHPLAVEDVIEQRPTKIERYGSNFFATVEQLCLDGDPVLYSSGQAPVCVAGSHVSAFCSGAPMFDTVVTIAQPDRSFSHSWPGGACGQSIGSQRWAERLRQRLTSAPRSRLRERRADFILYQVLDLSTDELQHVLHAYTVRLGYLEGLVGQECRAADQDPCGEVSTCRMQLKVVMRRVRGMQRLLRHFRQHPGFSPDLSGYLQDVVEHLDEAYEDAVHLSEKCTNIVQEQHRAADQRDQKVHQETTDRLNNTLFILTVGTFIFAPMQFWAAVYGMNFVNEDGTPSMPELVWKDGYLFFWVVIVGYLAITLTVTVCFYRRLMRRSTKELAIEGCTASCTMV